jgi:hypothetical protein
MQTTILVVSHGLNPICTLFVPFGGLRGLRPSAPPEPVIPSSRARNHRRSGSTRLIGGRRRDKSRKEAVHFR